MITIEDVKSYIVDNGLDSMSRKRELVYRRYYMYKFIKSKFNLSLEQIGVMFGGRDHATVLHGIRICDQFIDDKYFLSIVRNELIQFSFDNDVYIDPAHIRVIYKTMPLKLKLTDKEQEKLLSIRKHMKKFDYAETIKELIKQY